MSISVRHYLFAEDGLQRMSRRLIEGLIHGQDAMPQYAGTKQKSAEVVLECEDGKPVRIAEAHGTFLIFDKDGEVHESLVRGGMEAMETYEAVQRAQRESVASKVVNLSPQLKRDKWERDTRWVLSKADLDLISDDVWNRKRAATPKVQQAKGIAPKHVPLTYEAKEAIEEFASKLSGIDFKLEVLSEPALKGIAYEARRRASREENRKLWEGLAEGADLRREIKSRHRTGKGIWYASIDIISWDDTHHNGESVLSKEEKCGSKKDAEEAARRLLVEHAKYFSANHSLEAKVICDLEWLGDDTSVE